VLPWLLPDPDSPSGNGIFNCPTCIEHTGPATRAGMHCGYMPRTEWTADRDGLPTQIGPDKYEVNICPGWLVRQPAVQDGARAWTAWSKSALPSFDPRGLAIVYDCVEIFDRSMNLMQAERQRRLKARVAR
jgi:hypothetical protein